MIWGEADAITIETKCTQMSQSWIIVKLSPCAPWIMEKLSSTTPVPGAKWFGDSCLQEQQVIFRKGEWALRRQVGDVIVIKFIWVCPVLTCVESIFPGWWTPREGVYDDKIPLRLSVFRQIRKAQKESLAAFAIFQMPLAQNKQNAKAPCLSGPVLLPTSL